MHVFHVVEKMRVEDGGREKRAPPIGLVVAVLVSNGTNHQEDENAEKRSKNNPHNTSA